MSGDNKTIYDYLNILRVLAAFAVVLLHVSTSVVQDSTAATPLNWWIGNFVDSAARWCVPVFVMVGGALLLDPSKTELAGDFYRKRLKRIILPLIFWTVVYLPMRPVPGGMTLDYTIWCISTGSIFYHLWYLYMIPGLYLFTPFLRTYVRQSSSAERTWLIIVIFAVASGYSAADRIFLENQRSVFTMFIPFIGYYLCGYQLRTVDLKKIGSKWLAFGIIFCIVSAATITHILAETLDKRWGTLLYDSFSPTNIVLSAAIFLLVYRLCGPNLSSQSRVVNLARRISPTTLGIYLLHPALIEITRKITLKAQINSLGIVVIPVTTVVVFVLCYGVIRVFLEIPFLKRTVG